MKKLIQNIKMADVAEAIVRNIAREGGSFYIK